MAEKQKVQIRLLEFSPAGRTDGKRARVLQWRWWDGQEMKNRTRPDVGWTPWEAVPVVVEEITMTAPAGAEVVRG